LSRSWTVISLIAACLGILIPNVIVGNLIGLKAIRKVAGGLIRVHGWIIDIGTAMLVEICGIRLIAVVLRACLAGRTGLTWPGASLRV